MIVGRMFIFLAELFTDTDANPENIAYAVNVMSGVVTALGAMFVCWVTIILGKMAMVGRDGSPDSAQTFALAGAGSHRWFGNGILYLHLVLCGGR